MNKKSNRVNDWTVGRTEQGTRKGGGGMQFMVPSFVIQLGLQQHTTWNIFRGKKSFFFLPGKYEVCVSFINSNEEGTGGVNK